jgi:hypothetical protein
MIILFCFAINFNNSNMLLFLQIKLVVWQVSHTPLISPTQVAWLIHATNACFAKPLAAYFLPVQSAKSFFGLQYGRKAGQWIG